MRSIIFFLFIISNTLNGQVEITMDFSKDNSSTFLTLSQPLGDNPFVTFQRALMTRALKAMGSKRLVYKDSILRKNYTNDTFKKFPRTKYIGPFDLSKVNLKVELEWKADKLKSRPVSVEALYNVSRSNEKKIEKQLYEVPLNNKFDNKEYSFLVKSYFDQKELPELSRHLCEIYDAEKNDNLLNHRYQPTDFPTIKASMIEMDTFVIIDCFGPDPGERVVITKREHSFDDLGIAIYSEVSYDSLNSSFEVRILYYGMALRVIDPETLVMKYRKTKFLIHN